MGALIETDADMALALALASSGVYFQDFTPKTTNIKNKLILYSASIKLNLIYIHIDSLLIITN